MSRSRTQKNNRGVALLIFEFVEPEKRIIMKNIANHKIVLFCLTLGVIFTACKKENLDETVTVLPEPTPPAKIVEEWETYRLEKQELVLEGFVDGEPVFTMEWYDQTSPFSTENTLEFTDDNTFEQFYASVSVGSGEWTEDQTNENRFELTFVEGFSWSDLQEVYEVSFHCDHTMSVKYLVEPPAGDHEFQDEDWYVVQYFRVVGFDECDEEIDYYVQ